MFKKNCLCLLVSLLVTSLCAESLWSTSAKLEGPSYSINKPIYELSLDCANDVGVKVNDFCFVKAGNTVTINYTPAEIEGSKQSEHDHHKTHLYINDTEYKESTNLLIKENEKYIIRLDDERNYGVPTSSTTIKKLCSIVIYSISSNVYVNRDEHTISDYSGEIAFYDGEFSLSNGSTLVDRKRYSFSVIGEHLCGKQDNGVSTWYIKKGGKINIDYTKTVFESGYSPGSYSEGEGTTGRTGGSCSCKTNLYINNEISDEKIPTTVDEDLTIELKSVTKYNNDSPVTSILCTVKINVYKDDTKKPEISNFQLPTWKKDKTTITAFKNDVGKFLGTAYLEYLLKEEGVEPEDKEIWTRGSSCDVDADEGQIVKKTVYFRAVDYFGTKTDFVSQTVRIDKVKPTLNIITGWHNESVTLVINDEGSGVNEESLIVFKDEQPYKQNKSLTESGIYKVIVKDNVGNASEEYVYKIDKEPPSISMKTAAGSYDGKNMTNQAVTITATDKLSGFDSFSINENVFYENSIIWSTNGTFDVVAKDKVGNSVKACVKIDNEQPEIIWGGYSDYNYTEEAERKVLKSITINYSVNDNYSGIKKNGNTLSINSVSKNICSDKIVHYKFTDVSYNTKNGKTELDRTSKKEFKIKINVTDNAGNSEKNTVNETLTVPPMINIKIVESDDITKGIKRTYLNEDKVKVGILLNKIDFSDYKSIKLKREFLGDKAEGTEERNIIGLEEYKKYYAINTDKQYIDNIWNSLQECTITEKDVKSVIIDGIEYWYFEDVIETKTGMGHRGIRYQPVWEWELLPVTECGSYALIDKTANSPGKITIRLQGLKEDGKTPEYIELDTNGNSLSDLTMDEFIIPLDNMVPISFKIDDVDFDTYDIQITQYSEVEFINEQTGEKEKVLLPTPLAGTSPGGYIQKTIYGNEVISRYREANLVSEWYQFEVPEIEVSSEPPLIIRITMAEGCKGDNKYKDVTQSSVIKLQAGMPQLDGFSLNINEGCEYKSNIISSQPYKNISLSLSEMDGEEKITNVSWDFGDGEQSEDLTMHHAYKQSPNRKGDTSNYVLKISCIQGGVTKTADVNVKIIDTQKGALLGPEVWIGKHIIKNKIQVCDTTLTILNNTEYSENPTIVLGVSTMLENGTGVIDVFKNPKNNENTELIVNGKDEPIIFSECRLSSVQTENGIESDFVEIKTALEGGPDESLKWGGINAKNGANVTINNAEIKYATTGLTTSEDAGEVRIANTKIMYCSEYGVAVKSNVNTENISIIKCNKGIFISETAKLNNIGKIQITGVNEGIENNGLLDTDQLLLNDVTSKGITLNGSMTVKENLELNGIGDNGLELKKNSKLEVPNLSINGFIKGILNLGTVNSESVNRENAIISVTNTADYGIRNEGQCFAKELQIQSIGRGYIAGNGSNTKFSKSDISAPEINIHCIGKANANFGLCKLKGEIYGVKMDQDDSGIPTIIILKESIFDGFEIKWYDCTDSGGVLTDVEIENRLIVK